MTILNIVDLMLIDFSVMAKGSKPTRASIPDSAVTAQGILRVFSDDYGPDTKSEFNMKEEKQVVIGNYSL